ncbi:hypothetical protein AOLI_G00013470 [Acnodon oligacanthus]
MKIIQKACALNAMHLIFNDALFSVQREQCYEHQGTHFTPLRSRVRTVVASVDLSEEQRLAKAKNLHLIPLLAEKIIESLRNSKDFALYKTCGPPPRLQTLDPGH